MKDTRMELGSCQCLLHSVNNTQPITTDPAGSGITTIFKEVGFSLVENPDRAERRRLGRFNARVGELVEGQLSARRFERQVGGWRPLRGMRFENNPAVVLEIVEANRPPDQEVFVHERRRS